MTEKAAVTTIDTSMMDGAALAFIGDAVYEIYVRKHVLAEAGSRHQSMALKVDALHHGTVQFVNAEAQAFAIKAMADDLPEEEQAALTIPTGHRENAADRKKAHGFRAGLPDLEGTRFMPSDRPNHHTDSLHYDNMDAGTDKCVSRSQVILAVSVYQ